MMDWTDRHCRAFHRHLTQRARLYTEMVTADAVIYGHRERLIGFDEIEHPIALQLGGSDAKKLAAAARIGAERGYDEINLNVGCPSDRVTTGRFGACLMAEPQLVAECLAAMRAASSAPVTVKCRIGIDHQDPHEALPRFIETAASAGIDTVIVHARMAWLEGLSPKENREIPPLDYPLVYAMRRAFPHLTIVINGGVRSLDETKAHLAHVDGVMLGRAAYQHPWILLEADREIFGSVRARSAGDAVRTMLPYIERELTRGVPLSAITRHMLGLYHGVPGARLWRRTLSEEARKPGAGLEIVERALVHVEGALPEAEPSRLEAAQ